MQVKVSNAAPTVAFDRPNTTADRMGALMTAFAHHADGSGVFESSMDPIIVGQAAYNAAYGSTFVSNGWCNSPTAAPTAKCDGFARVQEGSQPTDLFKFDTLGTNPTVTTGPQLKLPFQPKGMHDEMNSASFDEWGRMTANLGLEAPGATPLLQNIILYPYVNPPTEILDSTGMPSSLHVTPISSAADGTQIWKITHNGVDTHPIHFHLYDVQVLNRVTWDNIILPPEPTELGWKDTVRISPLEDTIVALRPIVPVLPFAVPDSKRLLNPMMPEHAKGDANSALGTEAGFNNTDTDGTPMAAPLSNEITDFGWEYVFHCHILSHEEMDMMRPVTVKVDSTMPDAPVLSFTRGSVILHWTDGTPVDYTNPATWANPKNEIGYRIERAPVTNGVVGQYTKLAVGPANSTTYTDNPPDPTHTYNYVVTAFNNAGDAASNVITVEGLPPAPTGLTATVEPNVALPAGSQVALDWANVVAGVTSVEVERAVGAGAFSTLTTLAGAATSYTDTTVLPGPYSYRVGVVNAVGPSAYSAPATTTVPQAASTTVVTGNPNPSNVGQTVTLTATVSPVLASAIPSGTVAFTVNGVTTSAPLDVTGVATLTAPVLPAGNWTVTADYSGDAIFTASTGTVVQVVNQDVTSTGLVSSANPSASGDTVTFTATVTAITGTGAPTGTVDFLDGTTVVGSGTLASGVATFSTAGLAVGSHDITAVYNGDAAFIGSTSPIVTQVVNQGATAVLVTSDVNPSFYGTPVTFTATVTAATGVGVPTGVVWFFAGNVLLGSNTLDINGATSVSTSSLVVGSNAITATYFGDPNFAVGGGSFTQNVNPGTTSTVLTSNPNPSVEGAAVTFTATVSVATGIGSPTGSIQFRDGATNLGAAQPLTGATASISVSSLLAGVHAITAVYTSGDVNFTGSTSLPLTQNVLRATTTVVTSNRVPSATFGQSITFTATVRPAVGTGIPTGTVQFSIDGGNVGVPVTLNAQGRATFATTTLSAGTHSVVATYGGSTVFAGSPPSAPLAQVVNKAASTTVVTSSANPSVFGQAVTLTARVTPGVPTGSVTFTIDGAPVGPVTLDATGRARLVISTLAVGPHNVTAAYGGSTNYIPSTSANFVQTVNVATSRTVVTTSGTPANVGTTVTFTATVSAVAPGAGVPTGTVQFIVDGVNVVGTPSLVAGRATYSTNALAIGLHNVSAVYSGDGSFNTSTSANRTQRIR